MIQKRFKKLKKWFKKIQKDSDVIFSQWFKHFSNMIVFLWKKIKRVFSRGLNLKRVSVLFSFRRFFYPKLSSTASPDFYAIIKFSIVVYGYQKHERFFQYANIFCFLSKSFRVNTETQKFNYTTTYTEKSSVLNYSKQSHSVWKSQKKSDIFQ